MSDNEDLLGDDLGDQSLADYNLGNEEEEQLLADDYESGASQNVPTSISSYDGVVGNIYSGNDVPTQQPIQYHLQPDRGGECVVPNITVEVPNIVPEHSTYAPYEPSPVYDLEPRIVPPAIPAAPIESPQIVPSDMGPSVSNGEMCRSRFVSERPPGAQRQPQIRDIPDSLDKVLVPRGPFAPRGRTSWRSAHFAQRFHHFRRTHVHRGNFNQRASFPPPQVIRQNLPQMRPEMRPNPPQMRHELRPDIIPELRPEILPELRPEIRPDLHPDLPPIRPDMPPRELHEPLPLPPKIPETLLPERPIIPNIPIDPFRPIDMRPNFPRFPNQFRPNMEPRPEFGPNIRPNYEPRPMFPFQRPFRPFIREPGPGPIPSHIPQVTIRQPGPMGGPMTREAEVRMLPVQLPPNLPPGGLQGKKVLINPHFKGNFQSPVEGLPLPTYIPTRIQKTPPLSPTLESKFGTIKDIDDAAERFIAEQRNALARAANRKFQPAPRRSPTRYIENTTIEIENELAPRRGREDDELLRRQEEFINANRAGLRRRMRSASPPPRRSPSPRARPRAEHARAPPSDEESEYRRRMREQESLRERVLRAKEARRRKNAVANRERERLEKEQPAKEVPTVPVQTEASPERQAKPDTTRKSPEKEERDRSPFRKEEAEVNSTCENMTPPRADLVIPKTPERALTPPLPAATNDSDDDLDLILGDIDGILSDDDDTGRFKEKSKTPKAEPAKPKPPADLRSRLPPKPAPAPAVDAKKPKQRITFDDKKKKEKSPPRRTIVTSSTKTDEAENKTVKAKEKPEVKETKDTKPRQRITFSKEARLQAEKEKAEAPKHQFSNRRVILQRKVQNEKSVFTRIEVKTDPSQPNPGIFSRAVRTAIGNEKARVVVNKKQDEPQIEYESDSTVDEDKLLNEEIGNIAMVTNLPHGMTDTRLKTLAGNDVQNLYLDKEDRSAKITFKTTVAAENFKKKFNNKMVAASRLAVALR